MLGEDSPAHIVGGGGAGGAEVWHFLPSRDVAFPEFPLSCLE